jgi:hypothetical protein
VQVVHFDLFERVVFERVDCFGKSIV